MTWLAWLLLGVGVADLLAATRPRLAAWVPIAAGALVVATIAGLTASFDPLSLLIVIGVGAAIALWRALVRRGEASPTMARRALASLLVPSAVLLAVSGAAPDPAGVFGSWWRWMDVPALDRFTPTRALVLVAVALANTVTANHIVRLVLVSIHATPPRTTEQADQAVAAQAAAPASETLRGGRLLGPMERLLIVGLGSAGYLAAAGLVVAAKGLLRFPELQAAARGETSRVDEVTEYFLVGTFTSLLVALASVVLLA